MTDIEVGYHERASRKAAKLDSEVDERIQAKLTEMVTNEYRDLWDYDVERIAGTNHEIYRTRIGDYRVFFAVGGDGV